MGTAVQKAERMRGATNGQEGRQDLPRYLKLIPIGDARERISSHFGALGTESVRVDRAQGRVSASVVRSKADLPGVATCAMDGYAVRSEETRGASQQRPARFRMRGDLGSLETGSEMRVGRGEAIPVSTGDAVPAGADVVVRVEETRMEDGMVLVPREMPEGKNVSSKAEDVRAGEVILRKREIVNAAGAALLMSAGLAAVRAYLSPRVGIISVGSELKKFGDSSPGKVTNNYANMIAGYLSGLGVEADILGIARDDLAEIQALVMSSVRDFDMVVTIGGASVGPRDLVPDAVLSAASSKTLFHGLRAVPLRPVGLASVRGRPVVMLPGHAVSAALSFFVIALPVINAICGLPLDSRRIVVRAMAGEEFSNERSISAFVLARLETREGRYSAHPLGWGSNRLFNLSRANGFVHLGPRQRILRDEGMDVELLGSSELSRVAGQTSS